MNDPTRRETLQLGLGLVALGGAAPPADPPAEQDKKKPTDRDAVVTAGMTADEADCWQVAGELAGKFFDLPKMHPMDAQEVATAIHVIQNKLLSRPTYRHYLEALKAQQK
jgi:hypothetical protein